MIISKRLAKKLIKSGDAIETTTVTDNGVQYIAITRYDIQSTDHYKI